MKTRDVVIFSGQRFQVPQCIQRIDHLSTHGWQLRYGGTKLFSDHSSDGSGAAASFAAAVRELARRHERSPLVPRLPSEPMAHKSNDLPVGISGPILRLRRGAQVHEARFSVAVPRYGQTARRRSVYIANENTWSAERYKMALERAITLRLAAEEDYERDAARAVRRNARHLKTTVAAAPAARRR